MKKSVLVLVMLFCLSFVLAAGNGIVFNLERTIYDTNEHFDGNIHINYTNNVTVDNVFTGEISGCTQYTKTISLYDILENAGMANFDEKIYQSGYPMNTVNEDFTGYEKHLFAFLLENELVTNISFKISGNGGPFYLDVGDDGFDWRYSGPRTGWGFNSYSSEWNPTCIPGGSPRTILNILCENIPLNFDEYQGETDIKINAIVKRTGDSGDLLARIGTDRCNLSETTEIGYSWTNVSCVLHQDVVEGENEFEVCYSASNQNFQIPVCPFTDHYFLNLQKAIYDDSLPSSSILLTSSALKNLIKENLNSCFGDWCVVPMGMYMATSGNVQLSDLVINYFGGSSLEFYELEEIYSDIDVDGMSIPLDSFDTLKTPAIKGDNCTLKIGFMDYYYEKNFSVADVPGAVISADAYYVMRGANIRFDGSNSSVPGGATIVSWIWEFGDGSFANGSIVNHAYAANGNYTVKLTVEATNGLVGVDEVVIHVVDLEEHLNSELPIQTERIAIAVRSFDNLTGVVGEFFNGMGYRQVLATSNETIRTLNKEFNDTKSNVNMSDVLRSAKYGGIAASLNDLLGKTPKRIYLGNQSAYENYKLGIGANIPDTSLVTLTESERTALRAFNNQNVDVDFDLVLLDVEFLEGEQTFEYVDKTITVSGTYNLLVEDFSGFDLANDVYIFSQGGTLDNLSGIVSFATAGNIKYAVKSNGFAVINSIVYSNVYVSDEEDILIDFECGDGTCDYMSDESLGIDERDPDSDYYCPDDCKRQLPYSTFIILGVILLIGILYIYIYQGPGNFRQITNSISYSLFGKKLFVSERDKVILKQFVSNAKARNYNNADIRKALLQKGWSSKQIDIALKRKI